MTVARKLSTLSAAQSVLERLSALRAPNALSGPVLCESEWPSFSSSPASRMATSGSTNPGFFALGRLRPRSSR